MKPSEPLHPACQAAREELLAFLGPTQATPPSFHCVACEAWFRRAGNQAGALGSLTREAREGELVQLEGRVVAELNAGRRQDRAVGALAALKRLAAPDELCERLVEDSTATSHRAPLELDQRVAAELAAGPSVRVERQISALERLAPPAELEALVVQALARGARPAGSFSPRWVALAATLLFVIGAASLLNLRDRDGARDLGFRVVHLDSTAGLDPLALSLLPVPAPGAGRKR